MNISPKLNEPLLPEHVKYLSFEGGGGKGAAYLGVLLTLLRPEFDVFKKGQDGQTYLSDNILGVSGSSVGAITATLLGCGVPLEELIKMTLNFNPSKSADIHEYQNKPVLDAFLDLDLNIPDAKVLDIYSKDSYEIRKTDSSLVQIFSSLLDRHPLPGINILSMIGKLFKNIQLPPMSNSELVRAIERILVDDGLVPGIVMYKHINFLIEKYNGTSPRRFPIKNQHTDNQPQSGLDGFQIPILIQKPKDIYKPIGMNFNDVYEKYKRELVITGTNLSRQQLTYFSRTITPNFSIPAATRISASFPLFFKPVKISSYSLFLLGYNILENNILPGTWVDGGAINNHPLHAFDVKKQNQFKLTDRTNNFERGYLNSCLLPIVLSESVSMYEQTVKEPVQPIDGILSLTDALVMGVMSNNSTDAQYTNENERNRTLKIPTKTKDGKFELELFGFSTPASIILKVINEVIFKTLEYFGKDPISDHPSNNIDSLTNTSDYIKDLLKKLNHHK